jgi:hypothetical protein
MRLGVLTSCMDMGVPDRTGTTLAAHAPRSVLVHMGEVAQRTAQLLAWLCLAEQGHVGAGLEAASSKTNSLAIPLTATILIAASARITRAAGRFSP